MTAYEWTMVAITALGVVIAIGGSLIGIGRALGDVRKEVAQQIADEVVARTSAISETVVEREAAINKLRDEFDDKDRAMEDHFREVATSLRMFTEAVEKDIRRVELAGVNMFVHKEDFNRALAALDKSVGVGVADIKHDIGNINARLDRWIETRAGIHKA